MARSIHRDDLVEHVVECGGIEPEDATRLVHIRHAPLDVVLKGAS
jgi:hypothetical protein